VKYNPTPDEIAIAAAKIREGWDRKRWEKQLTDRELHWEPSTAEEPDLS